MIQNKKIIFFLVIVISLIFGSSFCFSCTGFNDFAKSNRDFDLIFSYDITNESGISDQWGVGFDGIYFYATKGIADAQVYKYYKNGSFFEEFTIDGVSGLTDLTYDGDYFFAGSGGYEFYKLDFNQEMVLDVIVTPIKVCAIAFDTFFEAFYVSDFDGDVYLIDESGSILDVLTMSEPWVKRHGFVYDDSGPYLWVFDQSLEGQYEGARLYLWDITAEAFTGVYYEISVDIGSGWGAAKGLFMTMEYNGNLCIGGLMSDDGGFSNTTDFLFMYQLWVFNWPPDPPDPPRGPDIGFFGVNYSFFTFSDDFSQNLYLMFDWGDGSYSDWLGPVMPCEEVEGVHLWNGTGEYGVRSKAFDGYYESDWSEPHVIEIYDPPVLEIESVVSKLFTIEVVVNNSGVLPVRNVSWSIELVGGVWFGGVWSGEIPFIFSSEVRRIESGFLFGFGKTLILVEFMADFDVHVVYDHAGFVFFPLIFTLG